MVHEDGVADLGFPAAEEFRDVGDELFQFFADDGGLEEEDTGVPEEFAGADEDFGQFLGRFFGESFHLQGAVQFPGIAALLDLDVAEVHVGVLGDDAEGHQDVVAGDELEHLADGGREQFLVPDDKVTRGGNDEGVGVAGEDGVGGESHAGGCLPGVRFQQEVPFRDLGEQDARRRGVFFKGDHQDVLPGHEPCEAVVGHPQIGGRRRASGHNDTIAVCIHYRFMWLLIHRDPGLRKKLHLRLVTREGHGDHVEEYFPVRTGFVQIFQGRGADAGLLPRIDLFLWGGIGVQPRFHFNKMQAIRRLGNDVHFQMAAPPVPRQDPVAPGLQVRARFLLTQLPDGALSLRLHRPIRISRP